MSSQAITARGVNRTRNVLANWSSYVVSAVVNFLLAPFVVHQLGDASYGIWTLLGSLVGYLGLLDLGVRGAVTRYVARFHALGDHGEASRVASTALAIFTTAGTLAIVVSLGVAVAIARIFNIPDELVAVARIVVVLGGINMAVSFVSGVYGGVVIGLQRFDYANAVEILVQFLRALAIVLALNAGFGLVALALIQLGMSAMRGLASYGLARHLYPQLRVVISEYQRHQLRMILTFSASMLLLQASGMLILFTDSVVIGSTLNAEMITLFAVGANLVEYARGPISGISHTLTPWASSLEAGEEHHELQRVLLAAARISTLVVLPIVLTFMVRGGTFIGLWMGPEYAKPSGAVLTLLSVSLAFAVGYQVVVSTMMGISRHAGIVPAFIVEALFNLGLSLFWVRSYGIIGVAWGTTIPRVIASVFFAPWYARKVLGTRIPSFWFQVWIRPAAAMLLFAGASYVVERRWPASNLFVFFAQVGLTLPFAAVGAWAIGLTRKEKASLLSAGILRR